MKKYSILNLIFLLGFVIYCQGTHHENEINKYMLIEEKLIQTLDELRLKIELMESEIMYIKRKSRQSYDILKQLEMSQDGLGCVEVTSKEKKSSRKRNKEPCPKEFPIEGQDTCYCIKNQKITWEAAREQCSKMEAGLVAIETDEEEQFILDYIHNQRGIQHCDFWTGGNDKLVEGQWIWNSTGQPLTYSNWNTMEPNNGRGDEHCLWLDWYFSWRWNDSTCNRQKACFICEINKT